MSSTIAKNEEGNTENRLLETARDALSEMARQARSRGYFGVLRVELTIQYGKIETLRTVAEKTIR